MSKRGNTRRERTLTRGLFTFFLVLVLAVGAGYAATKYVITPYFMGDGEDTIEPTVFSGSAIITDQSQTSGLDEESTDTTLLDTIPVQISQGTSGESQPVILYCIQYGSFQTGESATTVAQDLAGKQIDTMVFHSKGYYKVVSTPYQKEENARRDLEVQKITIGEDIFLTKLEATLQ